MTDLIERLRRGDGMRDTIWQLFRNGPTWDGNMVSKSDRDIAVDAGLVERADGWNWLTHSGVTLALELGMGRDSEKGRQA